MNSNNLADAENLVSELGVLLKLPDLKLNEQGVASLIADKSFSVNIEHAPADGVLHLYAKLMDLNGPVSDILCRKLMALNAYGNETGGASFAWDELHHEIILWKRVDLETATPTYFMHVLERFLDQVELWRKRLERGADSIDDQPSHTSSHQQQANTFRHSDVDLNNMLRG